MLAKHRLEHYRLQVVGVFLIAHKVAVDPQPVHLVRPQHFFLTNHRYIVLCMTGNNAGTATNTGIHIN